MNIIASESTQYLRDYVRAITCRYLTDLKGYNASDLYQTALREFEIPLFSEVLNHCSGNQSHAAKILGIHRATLRKKLKLYGITPLSEKL